MEGRWCIHRAPRWLGGLAALGMVAAHCLAYVVAEPAGHHGAGPMDATGHRFWGAVAAIGVGATLGAAAGHHLRELHISGVDNRRTNLFAFTAPRLAVMQLGAFSLLEASETLLMGGSLRHLLEEPAVIAGLVLQIVVALVSALILTLLAKVVTFIARILRRQTATPNEVGLLGVSSEITLRLSMLAGGAGVRGPPGS